MPSVAEATVSALEQAGVKRIYGVVGDSLNSVTDAVRRHGKIEWIHVRHEEAGAFAAGAEAQLSGQLTVCAGSCGPGNLHLINGLYDCHRSMAPVLAIAAHIPSSEIGTSYFQETHPERLFVECSHYCELISSPKQMPRTLQIAMQTAISKKGVSVIVLPGDVAMEKMPNAGLSHPLLTAVPATRPTDADLLKLADLLQTGQKATLLCGSGCAGAHEEVLALANRLGAPIVYALRGKEHLEYDNPYQVGMTGLIGIPSGSYALESCDVLLLLGTDFPYETFYPQRAQIAQIDLRPERLGRRCRVDLGLVGDIRETIAALLPALRARSDRSFLDNCLQHYAQSRKSLEAHAKGLAGHRPIHPEYLASLISDKAAEDAIFTADVGMCTVWAARYLRMTKERRLLGSFNHGSMANAMPQAMGAQLLHPGRQVVALSGDGGLSMLLGDLLTLADYDLPVKVVVFNNGTLGMVKLEMQVAGVPNFGTDFKKQVNFAKLAESIGFTGFRVEDPTEVAPALERALAQPGPVVVDVVTNPYELSMPPHVSAEQAWGFSLYLLKEMLGGHFQDDLELAESNLR